MKQLILIIVLFAACSTSEDREDIVNISNPDEILWRQYEDPPDITEIIIKLKDSCIYVTRILGDGRLGFHTKIHCCKQVISGKE